MGWNGAGSWARLFSWVADAAAGIDITASRMDADTNDITQNGLQNALTRDGQGVASANLPMAGFRHTGVGNGVARNDYAALGQVQDDSLAYTVLAGTDVYTGNLTPPLPAYANGSDYRISVVNPNTVTTPTIALNGLAAVPVINMDGSAVVAGSLNGQQTVRYDGANLRLLTPAKAIGVGSSTLAMTAALNEASATLASAASVAIGAAPANYIFITGTTTINSFDVVQSGTERTLEFQGSLQLTNSASLVLPNASNLQTQAGDAAIFHSEGGGNWRLTSYQRFSGRALVQPGIHAPIFMVASGNFTPIVTGVYKITLVGCGGSGGSATNVAGAGAGAGAGAIVIDWQTLVAGTAYAVTLPAPGTAAGAGNNGNPGAGAATFVGTATLTAGPGTAGNGTNSSLAPTPGIGGTASGGTININGGDGEFPAPGPGGVFVGGKGGSTPGWGDGGPGSIGSGPGITGQGFGSGGGGGGNDGAGSNSGAGAPSCALFEFVA